MLEWVYYCVTYSLYSVPPNESIKLLAFHLAMWRKDHAPLTKAWNTESSETGITLGNQNPT